MNTAQILGPQTGELIRELVPLWLVPVFVVITELGNVGFLMTLFTLDYWFRNNRRGAHAIGLAIGGMALVIALKYFFVVPRPPPEVNRIPIEGYSFPSGHATMAAIGYGILAYDVRVGKRWVRYSAASVLIALIALSRVVLGVHYVRDIIAGVLVGTAFLVVTFAVTRHDPDRAFVIAIVIAVAAVLVSGLSHDSVVILGLAGGAALSWPVLRPTHNIERLKTRVVLVFVVLPIILGLAYVSTMHGVTDVIAFLVSIGLAVLIVAVPRLVKPFEGTHSRAVN